MSLPKSLLKVTLKSHSQSHSQVTSKGHSQKSLPMDALHTQPRLSPASADHLLHLLGIHPGLPIDQDTFVTSALRWWAIREKGLVGKEEGRWKKVPQSHPANPAVSPLLATIQVESKNCPGLYRAPKKKGLCLDG